MRQDEEKVVILVFWGAFIFLLGTFLQVPIGVPCYALPREVFAYKSVLVEHLLLPFLSPPIRLLCPAVQVIDCTTVKKALRTISNIITSGTFSGFPIELMIGGSRASVFLVSSVASDKLYSSSGP